MLIQNVPLRYVYLCYLNIDDYRVIQLNRFHRIVANRHTFDLLATTRSLYQKKKIDWIFIQMNTFVNNKKIQQEKKQQKSSSEII